MSIGIVTSTTSSVSESRVVARATIASSTTSYAAGRPAWASASTIIMIPSAASWRLDPPSTRALANTNDTNAPATRGATDSNTRYPADSIGHKNYFQTPVAPLQLAGWSPTYRHTHTSLHIKRDSDQARACSDINFSISKKES